MTIFDEFQTESKKDLTSKNSIFDSFSNKEAVQKAVDKGLFPGVKTGQVSQAPYEIPEKFKNKKKKKASIFDSIEEELEDPGIFKGFQEGFGDESSSAILLGGGMSVEERELRRKRKLSFSTEIAKSIGDLLASMPVFTVGGIAGGLAGGSVGSAVPIVGTGVGTVLGSGAGAFALDTAIKTAHNEYLDLIEERPELRDASFLEIVQNIDKSPILIETVKSGGLGAIVSLNPLIRFLPKNAAMNAILKGTPGKFTRFGSEVTTLTVGGSALEGELPTPEQFAQNALVVLGLKVSLGSAKKIIRGAKNTGNFGIFRELKAFTKEDLQRIEKAPIEKVDSIISDIASRQAKADVKIEHRQKAQKVVADNLLYTKPKATSITELRSKGKAVQTIPLRQAKSKAIKDLSAKRKTPERTPSLQESLEVVDSRIERQSDKSLPERVVENVSKDVSITKLQTSALNDLYPVKDFTAKMFGVTPLEVEVGNVPLNVYMSLRAAKGASRMAKWAIEEHQFSIKDNSKVLGPGFEKILERFKSIEEVNELMTYKVSKRSVEKSKQGFNTGIPLPESKVIAKELSSKYEKASRELAKFSDNNLTILREAGLTNKKTESDVRAANKEYVSYARVFADEVQKSAMGRKVSKALKRFKGVDPNKEVPKILDPVESYIADTYRVMDLVTQNMAGQELVKASRLNPMGRRMIQEVPRSLQVTKASKKEIIDKLKKNAKDNGEKLDPSVLNLMEKASPETFDIFRTNAFTPEPNVLRVWWDGKPKLYKIASKELFDSFSQATSPKEFGFVTKYFLEPPASMLRAGAILDIRFLAKNPIRDYFGGLLFSKYNMSPLAPIRMLFYNALNSYQGKGSKFLHSLSGVKNFNKLYGEFIKSGGGLSTMQGVDAMTFKQQLKNVKNRKKFTVIQALRKAGELAEEAARLSEFEAALKVEGNTPLGRKIAAFAARDLSVDFAKAGVLGRQMNRITPFFNAQLQGTEKFYREFARNQASSDRLVYNLITKMIAPSMVFALLSKGDREIEELQDQERDFNWIYRNPVTGKLNKVPVAFEPGVVTNGFVRRFVDFVMKKDPKAFDGYISALFDSAVPGFVPQAILPIAETITNHNSFRGIPVIPRRLEGRISPEQYTNYTSETAKALGRWMMYMAKYVDLATGDEDKTAGRFVAENKFASPVIIDHFIDSWTGGLGKTFRSIADEMLRKSGAASDLVRPSEGVLEKYGINPFAVRYPRANTKSLNKFYDNYFFMKSIENSANSMALERRQGEAIALTKEFDFVKMDKAYKAISEMQGAINSIWLNPDMTADEKRTKVDGLYLDMLEVVKHINKKFEEAREKMRKRKRKN